LQEKINDNTALDSYYIPIKTVLFNIIQGGLLVLKNGLQKRTLANKNGWENHSFNCVLVPCKDIMSG